LSERDIRSRAATCLRRNPAARLRICCFPYAGGGASAFRPWADELPADVSRDTELWAVNLPGREVRLSEAPFSEIGPLTEQLGRELLPRLTPPYVFFGHSMGALLSFEIARQLHAKGLPGPAHIFVSGQRAPQLLGQRPHVHDRPDAVILKKLRRLGGTPEEVLQNPELRELLLPILRADLSVCERYAYEDGEPLTCSLTAFGGKSDREVSAAELSAWQAQTSGSFALRMFPGGHFFLDSARPLVLRVLGRELRRVLLRVSARHGRSPAV
jgi:medium-chain acyl-[acyl-carrier-protein] hydrolase